MNLLVKAMSFAAQKHKNQRRKGKDASPYINHPIDLAEVLVNIGKVTDINAICAALLHDTVEDTRTTREELTEIFGAEISDIVMEVTDDKSLCKAAQKQAQIDHAMHLSKLARAVKLADKICNLGDVATSPPNWSLARRQRYFDWAKKVIDGLRGEWNDLEAEFDRRYRLRPTR
ncbi:HD domain-containing protein [Gammaproteobacteria bacterium]|nr:HD domain-containing protein [Gammaproteobacteria bacterium]